MIWEKSTLSLTQGWGAIVRRGSWEWSHWFLVCCGLSWVAQHRGSVGILVLGCSPGRCFLSRLPLCSWLVLLGVCFTWWQLLHFFLSFAFSTSFNCLVWFSLLIYMFVLISSFQVLMKSAGKRRQLLLGILAIFPSVFVCFSGLWTFM